MNPDTQVDALDAKTELIEHQVVPKLASAIVPVILIKELLDNGSRTFHILLVLITENDRLIISDSTKSTGKLSHKAGADSRHHIGFGSVFAQLIALRAKRGNDLVFVSTVGLLEIFDH